MTTSYEFLAMLHEALRPPRYLEVGVVGVYNGRSLDLAVHSKVAVGIDPAPYLPRRANQEFHQMTSDEYFQYMSTGEQIDFAYIDGSHLFEDALRDFINVEMASHPRTVVAFDDMLPLNQQMTSRSVIPGHWTGDVWKVRQILIKYRPDLTCLLVDTEPTGTMVILDLDQRNKTLPMLYPQILDEYLGLESVPEPVLDRSLAVSPAAAIGAVKEYLEERSHDVTNRSAV